MSTKVITGKVRFSYEHVFKPYAANAGQEAKYSVCLLIPKSDKATMQKLKAAAEAARLGSAKKFDGKVPDRLKLPIKDGDEMIEDEIDGKSKRRYGPEANGCYVLNASSKQKPGVVDKDKQEILDPTDFYSGCYGRASLNLYAYNASGNKGIGAGLNHVQKMADGDPLGGGRTRAEDDFDDDLEEDDDGFLN